MTLNPKCGIRNYHSTHTHLIILEGRSFPPPTPPPPRGGDCVLRPTSSALRLLLQNARAIHYPARLYPHGTSPPLPHVPPGRSNPRTPPRYPVHARINACAFPLKTDSAFFSLSLHPSRHDLPPFPANKKKINKNPIIAIIIHPEYITPKITGRRLE